MVRNNIQNPHFTEITYSGTLKIGKFLFRFEIHDIDPITPLQAPDKSLWKGAF